ncbi:hypothetical protein DRQ25_12035 [Candidatus Fermentibacteria bacterium]|nr:MAG: hypothetical protein DRQ25_12035 [Candidatus Fermentibacteria bacterium]
MSYTYGTVGETKESCLIQGNDWEDGVCKEVSVKDYCARELGERVFDTDELMLHACYEEITLPEYKVNQTLRYRIPPKDVLKYQTLDESQVDRAMDLISEMDREENGWEWAEMSGALVTHQKLTGKQIDRAAREGGVKLKQLYERVKLPMRVVELALKSGKNIEGLSQFQDLTVRQMKRVIDLGGFDELLEGSTYPEGSRFRDMPPEIVEYAVEKNVASPQLYSTCLLSPSAINKAMHLDKRFSELYERLPGMNPDAGKAIMVEYAIKHRLDEDVLKAAIDAKNKCSNLWIVYEFQKLTPKQVEDAIELGYHIPALLAYQKISKPLMKSMISNLDYDTKQGKLLFNALWAKKDLPKDFRKTLAKKAGIEGVVGEDAHFVWSFIHPEETPRIVSKMGAAVSNRIKENPIKPLLGEYFVDVR